MTEHMHTTTEYRWYCEKCSALVGADDTEGIPDKCSECSYHVGGLPPGSGWMAMVQKVMGLPVSEENTTNLDKATDICGHGSMFNPNCPVCVERRDNCENCDGTGDVHSIDGQWLGTCHCRYSR